jgi:membrane-associated phospholipid phosphatase
MRLNCLVALLVAFAFKSSPYGSPDASAHDLVSGDSAQGNKYNFSQFGNETWNFAKQPIAWDGCDWLKVGAVGVGTLLIMQVDQPIREAVTRDQRYYRSVPIEAGRMWAELPPPVLLFSGFALYSWIADDAKTRKVAFELAQALLYSGAVHKVLNVTFGRAKPYDNEGPKSFYPFSKRAFNANGDYQSMPGGHCVIAFAMSTVLSRNAGPLWLKGLAYVPAALTFVSRIYQDRHWTSDDFIGASLGYFTASWVVDHHEQGESRVHVSSIFPLSVSIALD